MWGATGDSTGQYLPVTQSNGHQHVQTTSGGAQAHDNVGASSMSGQAQGHYGSHYGVQVCTFILSMPVKAILLQKSMPFLFVG